MAKIAISYFWHFFSIVPFHLVFVVTSKIKLIPVYCSHFEWPEIQHADLSWSSWELIRFWLSTVDFAHFGANCAISGHFLENTREEWPQIWHVDVFCPFSIDKILVTVCWYSSFWRYFDLVKAVKFGVSGIFLRTHGRNGLKFDMLIYPGPLWNQLHLGHGLLVFLILTPFWLSETGQMCSFQTFSWHCMGGMDRNLSCSSLSYDIPINEKGKF